MKYFIANWKANKSLKESLSWAAEFKTLIKTSNEALDALDSEKVRIIICPPYPLIIPVSAALEEIKQLQLGSQDLSFYNAGSYTGEVAVRTLEGMISYSIIGHSERRKYFKESDVSVDQKVQLANEHGIKPIVCVRGIDDLIPKDVNIVAYEPVWAIGTTETEDISDVLKVKKSLNLNPKTIFLYGAGVTPENAGDFISSDEVDGLLIGGASLDPGRFYKIISSAL